MHFLGEKTGRDVEFRELFDLSCGNADLFFKLAFCSGQRIFAFFKGSGGDLQKILSRRVAVLPNKSRRFIGKHRKYHRTPAMNDNVPLIPNIALADLIHTNIKNLSGVNRFGRKCAG